MVSSVLILFVMCKIEQHTPLEKLADIGL